MVRHDSYFARSLAIVNDLGRSERCALEGII